MLDAGHVFPGTTVFCKFKEVNRRNPLTHSGAARGGWSKEAVLNINVNGRDLNQVRTTSVPRKERQRPSTATSEVKKIKEENLHA